MHFQGKLLLSFSFFATILDEDQHFSKEFSPFGANFFRLRVTHFGSAILFTEVNRKSQNLFPFVEMAGKSEGVPIYLK